MTNYRRDKTKGGTFFFTVLLEERRSDLLVTCIQELRAAYRDTVLERPFHCDAFVVLPDHLHAVWTLPDGDNDFGVRWGAIKSRFTRAVKRRMGLNPILRSASKVAKGDAGLWQRRFWEHRIRDAADYQMHVQYCWGNPVKHGLVARPVDWPYSSIHRDILNGTVDPSWSDRLAEGAFGERRVETVMG